MYRTFVRYLSQTLALLRSELTFETDRALDPVDESFAGVLTLAAIGSVNSTLSQPNSNPFQRPAFSFRVERYRH
jgi:hypothetical protein